MCVCVCFFFLGGGGEASVHNYKALPYTTLKIETVCNEDESEEDVRRPTTIELSGLGLPAT